MINLKVTVLLLSLLFGNVVHAATTYETAMKNIKLAAESKKPLETTPQQKKLLRELLVKSINNKPWTEAKATHLNKTIDRELATRSASTFNLANIKSTPWTKAKTTHLNKTIDRELARLKPTPSIAKKRALKILGRTSPVVVAALTGWEIGNLVNKVDEKYFNSIMGIYVGDSIGPLIAEGDVITSIKNASAPTIPAATKVAEVVGLKEVNDNSHGTK